MWVIIKQCCLQAFWNLWCRKCPWRLTFIYLSRTKNEISCFEFTRVHVYEPKRFCSFIRTEAKTDLSFSIVLRKILRILRLYSVNACLQSSHWSILQFLRIVRMVLDISISFWILNDCTILVLCTVTFVKSEKNQKGKEREWFHFHLPQSPSQKPKTSSVLFKNEFMICLNFSTFGGREYTVLHISPRRHHL